MIIKVGELINVLNNRLILLQFVNFWIPKAREAFVLPVSHISSLL
jgi:hypothetical protein